MGSRIITAATGTMQTGGTGRKCLFSFRMPASGDGEGDLGEISISMKGASAEALIEIEQQTSGHGSGGSVVTPFELGFPDAEDAAGTAKKNYSADPPTAGEVIFNEYSKSGYTWRIPSDTKPGTVFAVYITAAADHPVCCRSWWREVA